MTTSKIHIYFVPGLAASPKIFEYLELPEDKFQLHFLEWLIPLSVNEPIEAYSKRMTALIQHPNPVLLGVSFGGIMVQEMSKHLKVAKIIIISSVKSNDELPNRLKVVQKTKLYKLFPVSSINNLEDLIKYSFGKVAGKRLELYRKYLSIRDEKYLTWALFNVLHWQQSKALTDILHIHGESDQVFPIKHIKKCTSVANGTHAMIVFKAKSIAQIIVDAF
jgi:pimeloyl-ACP methyl ester carboxylesterase